MPSSSSSSSQASASKAAGATTNSNGNGKSTRIAWKLPTKGSISKKTNSNGKQKKKSTSKGNIATKVTNVAWGQKSANGSKKSSTSEMKPPSTASSSLARAPKKKAADASESDSTAQETRKRRREFRSLVSTKLAGTAQSQRLAQGHQLAAYVREEGDWSTEETAEFAANEVRDAVAPTHQSVALPAPSLGPNPKVPIQTEPASDVFCGADGTPPSQDLQASYNELQDNAAPKDNRLGAYMMSTMHRMMSEAPESAGQLIVPTTFSTTGDVVAETILRELSWEYLEASKSPPVLDPATEGQIRAQVLPTTRAHDEAMLRAPNVGEPVCSALQNCLGNRIRGEHEPFALIAWFSQAEWAEYEAQLAEQPDTRLPSNSRRCLLCYRAIAAMFPIRLRLDMAGLDVSPDAPFSAAPFMNLVDVRGEYAARACILPDEAAFRGLWGPVASPELNLYYRYQDPQTGRMRVRQRHAYPQASDGTGGEVQTRF